MRGDFTLSSGKKSAFLFQLRQTTLHPAGGYLIGNIITEFMKQKQADCAGGLETGAVPVVTSIATVSHTLNTPARVFFVRKQAKQHGAKERVNGFIQNSDKILAVDDVTTTGGSMREVITGIAREYSASVPFAISIVDREEGAAQALAEEGIELYSIFRKSDFHI